jgi:hypothetical protein
MRNFGGWCFIAESRYVVKRGVRAFDEDNAGIALSPDRLDSEVTELANKVASGVRRASIRVRCPSVVQLSLAII